MRARAVALSLALGVLLPTLAAGPALAHDSEPIAAAETPATEQSTANVELVAHHYYPAGTDMQFQRRATAHLLDGVTVNGPRDYVFAGADAKSRTSDGALEILDVTDPTTPVHLVEIPCKGYHAEIAVYENLMLQGIDSASSNAGCDPAQAAVFDPDGLDQPGVAGVRVFDISDPARPVVKAFLTQGTHNMTVVPWAGLLYLATAAFEALDPQLGVVDLTDPALPVTMLSIKDWSPDASDGCHDIGLDPVRKLAFCAAIESTLIWDIADPYAPRAVSTIVNPGLSIHHGARLAPDGHTLVLNDEFAGAADSDLPAGEDAGAGSNGCLSAPTAGAVWFYDVTDPTLPVLQGSFAPSKPQPTASPCSSHFYNFIPDSTLLVVGWYEAGIVVVDYANPTLPQQHAVFLPQLGNFWTAYYWHGYLYGSSRTIAEKGFGGGLWVVRLDGVGDREPAAADEGTSWARWTGGVGAPPTPVVPEAPLALLLPLVAAAALAVPATRRWRRA